MVIHRRSTDSMDYLFGKIFSDQISTQNEQD